MLGEVLNNVRICTNREKNPIVLLIEVTKALYSKQPFEHTPQSMGLLEPKQ